MVRNLVKWDNIPDKWARNNFLLNFFRSRCSFFSRGSSRGGGRHDDLIGHLIGYLYLGGRAANAQKSGLGTFEDLHGYVVAVKTQLRESGVYRIVLGTAGLFQSFDHIVILLLFFFVLCGLFRGSLLHGGFGFRFGVLLGLKRGVLADEHFLGDGLVYGGCAFGLGGCGKGSFLGGFGIHEAILNVGAAAGIAAVADLRGGLLIFPYAKALTARGALRLIEGGLTLVALLLLTGLDFLLAGVDILLGLAFGAETFGLQTLCLQLLFTGAASGLTDLVLLVELLLVDLGQRVVTDDAEHTVCDPVDTIAAGMTKQIQMDMRGMTMFMLFMVAAA